MLKRLFFACCCAAVLLGAAAPPQPAAACPLICRMVNGHWVCGCG